MNRTYNFNSYESNCRPVRIAKKEESNDSILDALGGLLQKILSGNILAIVRAVASVLCFFLFIGVIGGVDKGTISIGYALVISAFLVVVEIACLVPRSRDN